MKRFLATGVLLLCLMSSQFARANENRDAKIKAEMIENYLLWQEAYKLKDAERIISFESPDFAEVSKNGGARSKEEADVNLRYAIKLITKVHSAQVEIKKLSIEPNRAVLLSNHYLDVDMYGPDDQLHRVSMTSQQRDIWVEYDQVWMLKRTEEISRIFMVDGKPEL